MNLEGSLDVFGLSDILQLLATTTKTGALHLQRPDAPPAALTLGQGRIRGVAGETARQLLAGRLATAGLLDDDALARTAAALDRDPHRRLGAALLGAGGVPSPALARVATDVTTDVVCELLRARAGTFNFQVDEEDPDPLPVDVAAAEVISEGERRAVAWSQLATTFQPHSVYALTLDPGEEATLDRQEWRLLALLDGVRSAGEIALLLGVTDLAAATAFASLVGRGLAVLTEPGGGPLATLLRRRALLAGRAAPADTGAHSRDREDPRPGGETPGADGVSPGEHRWPQPARAPASRADAARSGAVSPGAVVGSAASSPASPGGAGVATALSEPVPAAAPGVEDGEDDAAVTRSLLLRLIAGVRGL